LRLVDMPPTGFPQRPGRRRCAPHRIGSGFLCGTSCVLASAYNAVAAFVPHLRGGPRGVASVEHVDRPS
jgi:hypothetical protein